MTAVGAAVMAVTLAAGCMLEPKNGRTFAGDVVGRSIQFQGWHNEPDRQIEVQVLGNPKSDDPEDETKWITLSDGSVRSSSTPMAWHDPATPLYNWSVSVVPVPTVADRVRWPRGGLLRVRARVTSATGTRSLLTVFDSNADTCIASNSREDWQVIGQRCGSPYGLAVANQVSITPTPADKAVPPTYLTASPTAFAGSALPDAATADAQTARYYAVIDAPASLSAFRARYGFGGGGDEVRAVYFNAGDLGLGRDMNCRTTTRFLLPGFLETARACYVTNYGRDAAGNIRFDGDPTTVLGDTVAGRNPVATVAMVHRTVEALFIGFPPLPTPALENRVQFVVYDGSGNRSNIAALDRHGLLSPPKSNVSVPGNCLTCHGGTFDGRRGVVSDAHFLPFDVRSFRFLGTGDFTLSNQQDELRRLNHFVLQTGPTPAIRELVDGWYAPAGAGSPSAVLNADFVPPGWVAGRWGVELYRNVVAPYCRTCHIAQPGGRPGGRDWRTAAEFSSFDLAIKDVVCTNHVMPNALLVQEKFWQGPARAHLVNALGLTTACAPE